MKLKIESKLKSVKKIFIGDENRRKIVQKFPNFFWWIIVMVYWLYRNSWMRRRRQLRDRPRSAGTGSGGGGGVLLKLVRPFWAYRHEVTRANKMLPRATFIINHMLPSGDIWCCPGPVSGVALGRYLMLT